MEFIATCVLVFVVYLTAVNVSTRDPAAKGVYGFAIGATLGVACFANGAITGAGLNLWRMFPASLVTGELQDPVYSSYAWIYFVANTLAGPVCGFVWNAVYRARPNCDDYMQQ